jgi:hypothetical protein
MPPSPSPSPPSAEEIKLVVQLAWISLIALGTLILSFTITASISFWRTKSGTAKTFSLLFERAELVKLSAVVLVVVAVTVLALLGRIDSQGVVGVLGGIAGYVLGGLQGRAAHPTSTTENSNDVGDPPD